MPVTLTVREVRQSLFEQSGGGAAGGGGAALLPGFSASSFTKSSRGWFP